MSVRRVVFDRDGAGGLGVRIAVVDSGIAVGHPHVGEVAPGWSFVDGDSTDTGDRLGHGTAVAAAIREKAPEAELVPVRVLDRRLATSARTLCAAIEWAAANNVRLINLSLGTTNEAHVPLFVAAVEVALAHRALVVSATGEEGGRWYPGSVPGVLGVVADATCPRFGLGVAEGPLGLVLVASPFPRPIPGVVTERNLSGISFAVGNATGLLARILELESGLRTAADVMSWVHAKAMFAPADST